MISLPNDCKCSDFIVSPANWQRSNASLLKEWNVVYRFYEPGMRPKKVTRKGIKALKTLAERQSAVVSLMEDEMRDLLAGYNPRLNKMIRNVAADISSQAIFTDALQYALENSSITKNTRKTIEWILRRLAAASRTLNIDTMPIGEVRRKHIKLLFEQCRRLDPDMTNNTYNVFRIYLHGLFETLMEFEVIEFNPVAGIAKMPTVKKIRKSLTLEQQKAVNEFLLKQHPNFHRFLHMFFHSGCRLTELFRLQVKNVDMDKREFKIEMIKGKSRHEAIRLISIDALPMWIEHLKNTDPEDFVFSRGLLPGAKAIQSYQITKRWYRLIKKGKAFDPPITADFYSLKHSKITAVSQKKGQELAASLAGHTTITMVNKVYDLDADQRRRDELKKISTPFGQ